MRGEPLALVDHNLRACFLELACGRTAALHRICEPLELISLAAPFQMFNAAFGQAAIRSPGELRAALAEASASLAHHSAGWSLWLGAHWIDFSRRRAEEEIRSAGLAFSFELPGMWAADLKSESRTLPRCTVQAVESERSRRDFCAVGSDCFHVPPEWFSDVFDREAIWTGAFRCFVAYLPSGEPIGTAAYLIDGSAIGIYNVGTLEAFRGMGVAEQAVRAAAAHARLRAPGLPLVLQSTASGMGLYHRLGFRPVTLYRVYHS